MHSTHYVVILVIIRHNNLYACHFAIHILLIHWEDNSN